MIGWSPSRDQWGGPVYTVLVGGQAVATTRRTESRLPGPLPDGRYAWQVLATDRRGQERAGGGSAVRIDGTPPTAELVGLAATARLAVGVRFRVDALDEPPLAATPPTGGGGATGASRARARARRAPRGVNAAQASGLVGIRVEYGDGSVVRVASRAGAPSLTSRLRHRYLRPGRFRLRVVTRDVAGNSGVVERTVRVVKPKPKPKPKKRKRRPRRTAR